MGRRQPPERRQRCCGSRHAAAAMLLFCLLAPACIASAAEIDRTSSSDSSILAPPSQQPQPAAVAAALQSAQEAPAIDATADTIAAILKDVDAIRFQILRFWRAHGPDRVFGGFHGTLDASGQPGTPTSKGLVQLTRHVWAFATYWLHGYATSGSGSSSSSGSSRSEAGGRQVHIARTAPGGDGHGDEGSSSSSPHAAARSLADGDGGAGSLDSLLDGSSSTLPLLNSQQLSRTAFDFLVEHLYDRHTGMFAWMATREGRVLQDNLVIYGEWFVLYSFSQFYTAFGDERAKELAVGCFEAMDAAWHSSRYGGYMEVASNNFPPVVALNERGPAHHHKHAAHHHSKHRGQQQHAPPDSSSSRSRKHPEADAYSTSPHPGSSAQHHHQDQDPEQQEQHEEQEHLDTRPPPGAQAEPASTTRSLNVAMHGLEALTALHKVTGHPVVLARIHEYLDIICVRMARVRGLLHEDVVPSRSGTWAVAPGSFVNYGHNLESTWLVTETVDYLLSRGALRPALADSYRRTVMAIGAAAVRDGYDAQHGGVFEAGSALTGPTSTLKVWWVQAEAMLALWKLHQHFDAPAGGSLGEQRYLSVLAATARFVREHQTNAGGAGEQWWQVLANGTFVPSEEEAWKYNTMGNMWKASYHSSRAVLFLEKWMRDAGAAKQLR